MTRIENLMKANVAKEKANHDPNQHDFFPISNTFDTTFDFTSAAGSPFLHHSDHLYFETSSFENINTAFFCDKLKPLDFCRYVVDLQIFFNNMKCSVCVNSSLSFKDAVGVLPCGVSGYLIVRCRICSLLVRVALGKVHRREGAKRGRKAFDVNTKLSIGLAYLVTGHWHCIHKTNTKLLKIFI